ncbi:hypothetical protein N9W89_07625 [Hellea sp.]|nr:hypothetical protein [Hellea sp.]
MKRISKWHYLVIATMPLGVFLGLTYGPIGLIVVLAMNVFICHLCPDTLLFLKAPDSVNRLSGRQFYKASITVESVFGLTFFIFPIILGITVWIFQPSQIANLILKLSWADVFNDSVRLTVAYIADPAVLPIGVDEQMSNSLAKMKSFHPQFSLYMIIFKLAAYIYLPILTAWSTFDRTRAARAGYEFRVSKKSSRLNAFPFAVGALVFLVAFNYYASLPSLYIENWHPRMLMEIASLFVGLSWLLVLGFFDQLIARRRTFSTQHPSAYEKYLESKVV